MGQAPLTRTQKAALTRALDLASLTLAHYECIRLALRRGDAEKLKREIKRLRRALER